MREGSSPCCKLARRSDTESQLNIQTLLYSRGYRKKEVIQIQCCPSRSSQHLHRPNFSLSALFKNTCLSTTRVNFDLEFPKPRLMCWMTETYFSKCGHWGIPRAETPCPAGNESGLLGGCWNNTVVGTARIQELCKACRYRASIGKIGVMVTHLRLASTKASLG